MTKIREIWPEIKDYGAEIDDQIEINAHYRGYLKKQKADILALKEMKIYLFQIILIMISFQVYLMR